MDIIQPLTNQFNTNFLSSDPLQSGSTDPLNSQIPQQKITTSLSSDLTQGLNHTFPVQSLTSSESIIYLGEIAGQAIPPSNSTNATSFLTSSNNVDPLTGQTLNTFSGNSLSFLGTERVDNLYLKVGAGQIFEFSTDGINFAQVDGLILSADKKISVDLGSGDDRLYVDSSLVNALKSTGAKLSLDGGQGNDTLFGPNLDTTWNITGYNSGNFDSIEFRGVDNLKAAANNYATFVFTPDGNLSGVADGGDGNLGTLVIEGGTYNTTKFVAFGPHSGEIYLDTKTIRYAGLAPIFDNTVTADRVFTATDGDDEILVTKAATGQTSIFSSNRTFESISFFNPSNSLTIKGLKGNDRVTVDSLDPNFTKLLIIDGNDGSDSVIFSKNLSLNGGNLTVNAENITVNNGVIIDTTKPGGIDGAISFTASDTKSSFNASGQAQINLSGATIKAGDINISATSTVTGSAIPLPVAVVNLTSTANIAVIDSQIESSGNVTIASSSTVTGTAIAQGLGTYINTAVDAAVATSIINSSAIAQISGGSSIAAKGTLAVTATNKINATTSGDASAAMGGAGIAVATVTSTTQAYINTSSSQSISASSLTLLADSDNNITTTAKASPGGSTQNEVTPLLRTDNYAKTSSGPVNVAGALAFTKLSSKTEAYISSTNSSTLPAVINGALTIKTTSRNNSSAVADGSTVDSGASGVGVAVGINIADVTNKAYVGSNTSLKASSITIEALNPTKNSFVAEAISGAGSSSQVGVAGALVFNKLNTSSQALLQTGAVVDASGEAVVLKAENNTSSTTKAEAEQTGEGTVGVGASVAINIEQNLTEAALQDNATLTNAGDLILAATSDNSSATSVKAGSAGNISVTPALALTIVSNNTTATIGAGGTLTVGSLDAIAKHSGNTSANADAAAAGKTVGVGATFGFNIVDDTTIATTARNITSTIGDISFGAYAYAATGATAKAGAAGADPDAEEKEGQETSEDQANEQIDNEDNPNAQKHKDAIKGKAKTSSGSVSIAAGLALNLVDSTAKATLADGLVINSAGSFKLATSNETDAAAIADGSAVGGAPTVGVGVAVALNIVDTTNEATIGKSTTGTANVNAKGITLEAKMSDASLKGDGFSNFTAQATAGAGASNIGVAGAFALNAIGENSSIAVLKSGAIVDAGGGDVNFTAENNTNSVTKAEAEVEALEGGKSKVGVGASVAIDFEQNRAEASLQDNSTLTNAGKLTLAATSDNSSATSVKAGSAGKISVSPAVALTIVSNNTLATIGTGGTLTVGSLDAVAKHSGNTTTTADAAAAGSTVGVGASLSLNIVDDTTIATTARNITSTEADISFGAYAYAATGATAKAGAAGADPDAEEKEGENAEEDQADQKPKKTSEDQANEQIDSVEGNQNSAKHKDGIKGKAKTSSGSVSIAAGLALNLVDSTAKASLADGLVINSAGSFKLATSNETDAGAIADGSAVGGVSTIGVGVAVALNIVDITNEATIGKSTTGTANVTAKGVTVEAKMSDESLNGDGFSNFTASATAGAGANNVGVAGSFALNAIGSNQSIALIKSGAIVDAGGGDVEIIAQNNTNSITKAEAVQVASPDGTPQVGVGASVAIDFEQNRAEASLQDNSTLTNAGKLTLAATSDNSSATSVKAGSAGKISISPTVALTIVSNNTLATIGTGGTLTVGSLDAVAKHSGNTTTTADAAAAGSTVGVGASLSLNIVDDTTIATTARNITSTEADISFGAYAYAATGATAKAGAAGADPDAEEKEGENAEEDQADQKPKKTSEDQANEQIDSVEGNQNSAKHKDGIKGKAKTSSGSVSIAAGLALNLVDSTAKASLADGLVINSAGSFKLATSNETDASAIADGSAVGGVSAIGVGVAVALNIVGITNEATIGQSTTGTANVTAKGVTVEAKMSDESLLGDGFSNFTASATAGAGANNVGVAGSFALNAIGSNQSIALIKSGAIVDAGGGDVEIIAQNNTNSITKAEAVQVASPDGTPQVGVGASVAIDFEQNRAEASLQDNSTLTNAGKLTLAATSDNSSATSVKAGSAGKISISPTVALTIVSNNTLATIGTGGTLTVGSLDAVAKHSGNTTTTADAAAAGSTVGVGASLSLNIVDDTTIATTARNITSTEADISFGAYAYAATGATAKAGAAGADPDAEEKEGENAEEDQADQKPKKTSEDQANEQIDSVEGNQNSAKHKDGIKGKAKTSSGSVSIAAGLALNLVDSTAKASLADGLVINSAGSFKLATSNETDASAIADGSAVGGVSAIGVGVAVALNIVGITNEATIGQSTTGTANVTAKGVTVEAKMSDESLLGDGFSNFTASATAGAGANNVGVAGSFALNAIGSNQSIALIKSGAIVDAGGGDVEIIAQNNTNSITKAEAVQVASPDGTPQVGVGASVAIDFEQNRAEASLQDNSTLTNAGKLTLAATSDNSSATSVKAGSAGKISISPTVALTIVSNNTLATIGTGGTLTVGSLDAVAKHSGNTTTTADAAAAGSTVGVGASLSLNIVDDTTIATTARNITSTEGDISFGAYAYAATGAAAKAGSAGADPDAEEKEGENAEEDQADQKPKKTSEDQANEQVDSVEDNPNADKHKGAIKGKAKSNSDGAVSIAAALALNLANSTTKATLADNLVINAAGEFKLGASNETDGSAIADGSAVDGSNKVGIGAAVALNIVNASNQATLGTGAEVSADGVTLEAKMSDEDLGGDGVSAFTAESTSGAGAENVGVAGSFALNFVNNSNEAVIKSGANVNAGSGDITLIAANNETNDVKATSDASGGNVGVGASIGMNLLLKNSVRAEIEDNVTLSGGGSLTLDAKSERAVTTTVEAGSSGGVAVSPAVGLAIVTNDTIARLGAGVGTLDLSGNVSIKAERIGSVITEGNATAAGDKVAVGAIVAVNVVKDNTSAELMRDITTSGGSVVVASTSNLTSNALVLASASGNKQDGREADDEASAQSGQKTMPSAKDSVNQSNSSASSASGGTGGSGVGVAAAVGVNWQIATNKAIIGSNVRVITKGGAVTVSATNQTNAKARAIGTSMSDTAQVNVSAAVGLNVADVNNIASVGSQAIINAQSTDGQKGDIKIEAVTPDESTNEFVVWGFAASGGNSENSKASVAGSVGVNVLTFNSQALVGNEAQLATSGAIDVIANSPISLQNLAISGAFSTSTTGGAAGAAIAVNVVTQSSIASIGANATIDASESISVSAESSLSPRAANIEDLLSIVDAVSGQLASLAPEIPGLDELFAPLEEVEQPLVEQIRTVINEQKNAYPPELTPPIYDLALQELDSLIALKQQGLLDLKTYLQELIDLAKSIAADFFKDFATEVLNLVPFSNVAIGAGVSDGKVGIGGSVIVNIFNANTLAYVSSGTQINQGANTLPGNDQSVNLFAKDTTKVKNVAGGLGVGTGAVGIGIGVDVEILYRNVGAYIDSSTTTATKVKAANGVSVQSSTDQDIFNLTLSGGLGGKLGIGGTVAVNQITNNVIAGIAGTIQTEGDVSIAAIDNSKILALAGGFAVAAELKQAPEGGPKASIGAAVAVNKIASTTVATINRANVTTSGGLSVNANSNAEIKSVTIAGSGSVSKGNSSLSFAAGASIAINTINSSIIAEIANGSTVKVGGQNTLAISAKDNSKIEAFALGGALAVGISGGTGGTLAIGVSAARNEINNTTAAYIDSSTVGSSNNTDVNIDLQALSTNTISAQSIAVAISVAKGSTGVALSGGGAGAGNFILTKTNAYVKDSNLSNNIGNVAIKANNTSNIDATVVAVSGSVSIGSSTGVGASIGAAVANNFIGYDEGSNRKPSEVQAYIQNSSVKANGDLTLNALADGNIIARVGAGSVAVAASTGGTGLSGSGSGVVTSNKIATLVKAFVNGATSIEAKTATLTATDSSKIKADAGAASIAVAAASTTGGSLSIGVSVATNLISNEVEAFISGASNVRTTTGGISLSGITKPTIEAVSVAASIAVGAAGTTGVGISGAGAAAINTILTKTNAYIKDSAINSTGAVTLNATNTATIDAKIAAVSVAVGAAGTTGVGVSIGMAVANNYIGYDDSNRQPIEVQAYIQNSSLTAQDLTLNALSGGTITAGVGAGSAAVAAAGTTGVAAGGSGVVTLNKIATLVKAFINGDGKTGIQASTAALNAKDTSKITADAGAASLAIGGGGTTGVSLSIGVSVASNLISNEVEAFIKNAGNLKTTTGLLSLAASTDAAIKAVSVAASIAAGGGGTAGVTISGAGAAAINTILTKTNAYIKDSVATSAGSVNLAATNSATIDAKIAAVSVSAGGGGTAGVGVSIGAAVANNFIGYDGSNRQPAEVQAYIQNSSMSAAGGDLTLSAINNGSITAGVGAGSAAVSGGGTAGVAASGSGVSTENKIATLVKAFIDGDAATGIQAKTATLTAKDSSTISADAGAASVAASFGGTAGVSVSIGVSIANNLISNEVEAFIRSADNVKTTTGNVLLSATTDASIRAVSVAASIAASFGGTAGVAISGAGAASINTILTKTNAYIKDSAVNSAGAVSLDARNTAIISATVAAVSASVSGGGTAGVGVSIGAAVANNFIGYDNGNRIPAEVQAYIQNSSMSAGGDLTLNAINDGSITAGVGAGSAAISGGGTVGVAASGSGVSTENKIATLIKAFIDGDGATGIQAKTAALTAKDSSKISADAGAASIAASFSGTASVSLSIGVALAHNVVTNEVQAFIQNADNSVKTTTGDVSLSATTDANIKAVSVAASLAVGISGTAGIAVSGAGAESTNTISTRTNAYIKDSVINSAGAVGINANNTAGISAKVVAASAAAGASGTAGVAASIGVAIARNLIGWGVDLTDKNYKYTTGSGTQSLNRGDRVLIAQGARAGDIYEFIGDPASIDLQKADYAKTSDWKQVNLKQNASEVLAYTNRSSINAGSALTLSSLSSSTIEATVASASMAVAGGIGGASLSGSGVSTENKIATKVQAYIDGDGSTGISAGSVGLTATDTSSISANAEAVSIGVTIAIGGAVTIGVSLARNEIANDVRAFVQNVNNVTATNGGIELTAKETSTITAISVAASAAVGLVGVAGAGAEATNTIANAAKSYISNAVEVKAQIDVTLISSDKSIIRSLAGQFSAGTAAAIGVSVATNTISNQIIAEIANSNVISSTGAIKLGATSNSTIETLSIGGSVGGAVAAAGATTLNKITSTTSANTRGVSTLQAAGAVSLTAFDDSTIKSLAGQLSIGGAAGVGAGVATNDIANNIIAELGDTAVTAGSVALSATSNGYVGSIAVGASGGGTFALGGAITLNKIANVIRASTSGASEITTTGSVSLQASDTPTIESLAGQVSGGGGASVGLSLAKNEISSQVIAEISNTTFKAKAASVSLTATSVGSIRSAAVGGAAAGALAAGGSVTLNTIRKVVKAAISGGSDVQSQGAVSLTAFDHSPILSLAGQVAVAGAATVGIAVATNDIVNQVIAEVNNSKATSKAFGVTLNATSTGSIKTLGIAGAVSGGFSGAGAVTLNSIANVIKANIVNGSDIQSAGNLNLTAKEDAKIESLAGSISVGGAASVGASVATNNISSQIIALVSESKATISGAVNLSATSTGTIDSLAAGGTGAGTFAAGGAVTVNNLSNRVQVSIANGSDVQAQGNVGLTATNSATIQSLAGQITGAGGAAIGASVAVNNSSNTTQVYISDSTVDSKGGLLKAVAKNTGTIKSASAGASISGAVALTGSVSVNNITNTTDAHASNVTISSLSGVEISAVDEATIQSFAGQISVGIAGAGVGAAVAYNNIGNIVTADVTADDWKNTNINTSGNVIVSAEGKGIIDTIAVGGSAGLFVGAGASVAVNQMSNNVSASVQNNSTIIKAKGSVGVLADSTNSMTTKGGTFSAGFIGLGGTIAVNNLENTTRAYVNNSSIDAGSEQSITIPKTDGSGTDESFQGVAVLATSKDNLGVTIGTGGVGGFAFVASVAVNNFKNITEAYGNNVAINATSGSSIPQQSVYIKAFNDSTVNVNAGTAGGGLAAVGIGIDITTMKNATSAYINSSDLISSVGSVVNANKDLVVEAKTQKSLNSNVVALGGGVGFSVQGAVSIINVSSAMSSDGAKAASDTQGRVEDQLRDLNRMGKDSNGKSNISTKSVSSSFETNLPTLQGTTAFIAGHAGAGNNLIVNAYETTKLNVAVGSLSAGLISVGGAVGVANITHNASAYVGDRSRLTGGNITIQSTAFVDSTAVKAVAGSAGAVGLGAAVAYLSSENNSKAYVGNYAVVTQASNADVIARSSSNLNAQGLGASYGLAAGGIVIANVRETGITQAFIGDEVAVENTDNLNVKAIANEAVTAVGQASTGGIISGNGTETSATVNPNVAAYIGNNSTIKVAKDVNVVSDVSVDGDAASKGASYGLLGVGLAFSQVNANPVINTYVGTNTTIEAGNVTISSSLGKAPVSADTSFNPGNAVNNTADSITFTNNHGLRTGDIVVYSNGGGSDISGLENQASYAVIVVNDKTVKLGSEFTGTEVDTKFNTIKFANGHNFKNGQQVIFEVENGNNVGGLTSGQKYYVKVIDGSTIQLSNTSNIHETTQGAELSGITTVAGATTIQAKKDNNTVNVFQNGDTVAYKKRSALFTVDEELPDTGGKANIFNLSTGDIVSKDTINSASHGFETGDQIIYTATGTALGGLTNGQKYYVLKVNNDKFQLSATLGGAAIDITSASAGTGHKITAAGLKVTNETSFTYSSANANQITVANHGFTTGQTVTYQAGSSQLGGLTNGATYFVIKINDNTFKLASTLNDAQNNTAIALTANSSSHKLIATSELEEGVGYYVVNATGTSFQLSEKSGGQSIVLDKTGLTGTSASHLFAKQSVVDLTSTSAGRYNLHLDLENGTATGTKHLLSSGASIVLPSQGDQVFSAYSQASSGAAIAGSGAKAGIGITPTMNTYVGNGASITATGNVKVQGLSNVQVTGAASTNTGGLVGIGIGELGAVIVNNNKTTVFSNAAINAAGNVTIDGESTHKFNISTDSSAGGLIPIGRATATAAVIHNTITEIGSQANITSQRDLIVHSGSDTSGFVSASANGGGLIPFAYGTANIIVQGANEAKVNSATLTARKLTVESAVDNLNVNALGLGKAGGLIGIIQGKSNINLNGTRAITTIGSGASLKADELNLNAVFKNVNSNSIALGHCDGLGGKTDSDATNYMNLTAAVNTDVNSTLTINSLNVKSGFDIFNENTYAHSKKAWELRIWTPFGDIVITLDFGRAKSDDKQINPQSFTNFNSNVIRLARQVNPVVVVDASGQVSLKSDNVTVTDNGTDINIGNISATGGGKVTFSSGAKSTGGSFIDNGKYSATDPAFDSVEIQNYSNKNLIINDIGAISTGSGASLPDYSKVNVNKTINATTSSSPLATNPTLVTINNWGNSNLVLKGIIENPHDRTILYSNGNIFSQGTTQKIITRDLKMTAMGSIGADGQRIAAQLNQGYTPVTSNVLSSNIALDIEAENSTYLDLTAKGLDDNSVTVNMQKMTAKKGEVNLTIGQTTNKANTSISAVYKFTGKDGSNRGINARTNIAINAGSTTTNIDTTTEFSGIAGSLDVVTGGLIKVENVAGKVNLKRAVSHQDAVNLSGQDDIALVDNAVVQAAKDITLTATKLSMLNNANLQAATDVTFFVEDNFQINSTARVAGNNVMIQGDYNNKALTGTSITIDGWIYAQNMSIYGNTKKDIFNIRRLATTTDVYTGGDDDIVNIGSSQNQVNEIQKRLSVYGGMQNDVDTLNINNSGDTSNSIGVLTDTSVTGLGIGEGIYYSGFEVLNINLGTGNNDFTILNTSATTNIASGAGNDKFRIGPKLDANGNVLDETVDGIVISGTNILGTSNVTNIKTGAGNDYIQVNRNTGLLDIEGENGDDTFVVNTPIAYSSSLANATVNISGDDGNDTTMINSSSLLETIQNNGSSVNVVNSRVVNLATNENLIINQNSSGTTSSSGSGSTNTTSGSNSTLNSLADRTQVN